MICIGIDPGLDGAVAVLHDDMIAIRPTPTIAAGKGGKRKFDLKAMRDILFDVHVPPRFVFDVNVPNHFVVIEKASSRPGQGVSSVFSFGEGFGMWQGLLAGLFMSYEVVTPQKWKAAVLGGTTKDKQAAIEYVSRRYPTVSLLATPRSKVPHDGMADALCLAVYAGQVMNGHDRR